MKIKITTLFLLVATNLSAFSITNENKLENFHFVWNKDFYLSQTGEIFNKGALDKLGLVGLFGTEDQKLLTPAINELNKKENISSGPFSADTFFCNNNYAKYDAILAVYHDQGLIPFKTISFGEGVNYSAGLPIIRTSPDHGTGFNIAGKSIADSSSFKHALKLALDIFELRNKIV